MYARTQRYHTCTHAGAASQAARHSACRTAAQSSDKLRASVQFACAAFGTGSQTEARTTHSDTAASRTGEFKVFKFLFFYSHS